MEYIFNLSLDSPKMCLPTLRNKLKLGVLYFFHPSSMNAMLGLEGAGKVRHGHAYNKVKI